MSHSPVWLDVSIPLSSSMPYYPGDPAPEITRVQALEDQGTEVLTISADVADEVQMRAALEQARERFGAIHGVIHTAGIADREAFKLIAEAGRDDPSVGGAIKYRTTPLFERIFGLESLSALPRLDDLGADAEEIRERLHAVAEKRTA